ncbi:hypothetical protein JTB14_015103 [Gonioctena quinquepunctata]|nr:hypothetical protein JTB14_015103 [Gonioctena quinquepunctata]
MQDLFKDIHKKTSKQKSDLISKRNESRNEPPTLNPGTIGYLLKSNDLTIATTQNTYHKQIFKPPRKVTDRNIFQVNDDSSDSGTEGSDTQPQTKRRNPSLQIG